MAVTRTYPRLQPVEVMDEVVVVFEERAYIGRVFEGGLWSFDGGREALAVGLRRPCAYDRRQEMAEPAVRGGNVAFHAWRSLDGGLSWTPQGEVFNLPDVAAAVRRGGVGFRGAPSGPVGPDVILSSAGVYVHEEERAVTHVSLDRGRTWLGPAVFGYPAGGGRTLGQASTVLRPDGRLLAFFTRPGPAGRLRPLALQFGDLAESQTWSLLSYLPADLDFDRVWPCAVLRPDGVIVAALTERRNDSPGHTLIFRSEDLGRTWDWVARANDAAEPAHLAMLRDGRLLLTAGWPLPPRRILAQTSEDGGVTWGPARVVREGGGSSDLGSVRSVVRDDGAVVSVYQWNNEREADRFHGGRRHLAATVWRP